MGKAHWNFAIGNPPYQKDSNGANNSDTPVYQYMLDGAYSIADKVTMIHPARFLFNAGATPQEWNKKMLEDPHVKVEAFTQKSASVFPNVDIKGGVAITYRDLTKNLGPIGIFTPYIELNTILKKVWDKATDSLASIVTNRGLYRYSDVAYHEQPNAMAKTADRRIAPSAFERMPELFTDIKPQDNYEYIQIYGNVDGQRAYKWFRKDYVIDVPNLHKYKVMVPKANGCGSIGEVLSTPLIGTPLIGYTETYISIGCTDCEEEAEAILKYVKTKFARAMLGVLKVTQNNPKPVWKYVPLQDFTSSSDIDWSKSIPEIDQQLYRKYGLSDNEVKFIEEHVKAME